MCFGNDGPQLQHIPDPPPEKEMMDFVNYNTGTETVTVTDASGKRRRITRRLTRPPNEQARFDIGEDLIINVVRNLSQLNRYNPKSMISFAPVVQAFSNLSNETIADIGQFANLGDIQKDIASLREANKSLIDEQFDLREHANEERLAHSGRGDGIYAAQSRAAMARARGLAHQEGDARARTLAEDLAAKRLATNTSAFNVRDFGRKGALEAVQADYELQKADEQDQEARRLQAIQDNSGMYDIGTGLVRYDDWKALQDRTQDQALATYAAENNVQNARYGAQVNAINANNQMAMEEYKNREPSFGAQLLGAGVKLGAAYLTGGGSMAAGGGMGSGMFGGGNRAGMNTVGVPYFSRGVRR